MKIYIIYKLKNGKYILSEIISSIDSKKIEKYIKQKEINKKTIEVFKKTPNKFYLGIIDKSIFNDINSLELIEINFVDGVLNQLEININKSLFN